MVDDDSLTRGERQTEQRRTEPVEVHEGRSRHGLVPEEYRAVQNENQVGDLAAEPGHIADHDEPIGVLYRLAQPLVTSTKFSDASSKLSAAAYGATEVFVQCAELVVEDADEQAVMFIDCGNRCPTEELDLVDAFEERDRNTSRSRKTSVIEFGNWRRGRW